MKNKPTANRWSRTGREFWPRLVGRARDESGYSLMEVIVAILLLSLAIIPMVGMFDAGLRAAVLGSNHDQARALANSRLEETKALPYEILVDRYRPVNAGGSGVVEDEGEFRSSVETTYVALGSSRVVESAGARTMVQVDVRVTWDEGDKSYETTGLISKD